ncbi:uncharacterized protein BDZ99DRAFT_438015 [Mytilinidion resinicola]|uniref:1-alkyl-2-acetylglycerophosphocholine esterase n=1 Tax=Mytilinidion resinicola TaxID=574789 RepID=A0A6A6YXH7_9PEZI|nr:uncharacterized protein BDZ99DRAFT_438015 [Mytilinidion resinicola]KAF2813123.1 hypothetical protein BDZ99DRAFT_438015 [Mytilinidion resinicola]
MSIPDRITGKKSHESQHQPRSIPNAKKPKSRPPQSFRDKAGFLQSSLPKYSGPYSVGIMELEIPARHPQTFSHIKRHGHHILRLETVLITIYYPSAFGSGAGKDPSGNRKWSRQTWLPRPRIRTAQGYGKFASVGDIAVPFFAATTMFTKIPAFRNSRPATHWPPPDNFRSRHGPEKVKNREGPPPEGKGDEPTFPLMFFSHGLGGTRTMYSSLCGEFASYGFVVCAVEHRDGSGPRTFVNHAKEGKGSLDDLEQNGHIDHCERQRKKGYDKVDYIFPKGNRWDTSPLNEKGPDKELRDAQTQLRLAELEEAYHILCQIRNGKGEDVARKNLRRKGYVGSSSRGLEGVDWDAWKGRFHTERCTVAGHSFGAATTIEVLRHADRFKHVEQGIIYDIWGAAINPPEEDPCHRIHTPLLGINSEAFMYWPSNFSAVSSLIKESRDHGSPAWLTTVRGTVHVSQSDFSILYPATCSMLLKATANPKRALDLNISASLEFLKAVMGEQGGGKAILERCMLDEGLLRTEVTEELPEERRPDDKWVAARLKIPHEFRTRLGAKFVRKERRRRGKGSGEVGDEIWMHVRTEKEEFEKWREQSRHEQGLVKTGLGGDSEEDVEQGTVGVEDTRKSGVEKL